MTDGQTDRPRCSVCNNMPHLASTVMRPNNKNDDDSLYTSETQSQSESVSESFGAAVVPRMVVCSNGRLGSIPCLQHSSTRNVGQCPTRWQPCRIYVAPSVQCRKVWPTPTTRLLCSNTAKTQNPLKFVGVPQTRQRISAVSRPKFTILSGHVEEVLLFNKFFFRLSIDALVPKI